MSLHGLGQGGGTTPGEGPRKKGQTQQEILKRWRTLLDIGSGIWHQGNSLATRSLYRSQTVGLYHKLILGQNSKPMMQSKPEAGRTLEVISSIPLPLDLSAIKPSP
jgi:hypothetical protein